MSFVWKSLVASYVHVAEIQMHIFNTFVSSTIVFITREKLVCLPVLIVHLQYKMRLSLVIKASQNEFYLKVDIETTPKNKLEEIFLRKFILSRDGPAKCTEQGKDENAQEHYYGTMAEKKDKKTLMLVNFHFKEPFKKSNKSS